MSDNTALYRKYRPQTFEDVLGQDDLVRALKGAIAQKKIGHAYLFSGGRGIGKTTLARIFAREIGTSEQDLIEIDAASNRGIDDIRTIREEVHTMPLSSPYKVYVVDEVHMLTTPAFNALLKTLEEPPRHVIFILATTEPESLPDTIVSRCQTFSLARPSTTLLRDMVEHVARKEGRTIDRAGAERIALLADGAFRDAHGILQKILGSTEEKSIAVEDIETITGTPKSTLLINILNAIAAGNVETALSEVDALRVAQGNARTALILLTRLVRAVLIARTAPSLAMRIRDEYTEEEWQAVQAHAQDSVQHINSRLLTRLLDTALRMGTTYLPELPIEITIIEHLEQQQQCTTCINALATRYVR